MEIISKIGFLLILCLGLFAGYLIAKNTKEELKKGKKYFLFSQYILISTIAGTILWQQSKILAIIIGLILFGLQILFKSKLSFILTIPILTVIGLLDSRTQMQIFLYTIPAASYAYPKKLMKEAGLLLVAGVIMIIIQSIF